VTGAELDGIAGGDHAVVARPRRLRRTAAGLAAIAAAGAAAVAVGHAVVARPQADASTATEVPTGTAPVTRGTVTQTVKLAGTLGFDGGYQVVNQLAPGIVTGAPEVGATIERGGTLYAVANRPVRLLYGTVPAYRAFASGMPDGPDVRELEENLVALGDDPGHAITVDEHFTAATAAAIRRWQAANGLPVAARTGALDPGEVVFLPGALRVSGVTAGPGTPLGPDQPVLTGTSVSRVVTVQLSTNQQSLVHAGDQVRVSIAGTPQVAGTVGRIGRVATGGSQADGGGPNAGGSNGGGGGSNSGPATVTVTITLTVPPAVANLDQAPVQVAIVAAQHPNVLLVPVSALLARPGGGYQVRLASGGYQQVEPGLYDDDSGTVEVTGAGLHEGDRVEVPTS
jgi:peptidoglycan hydrolase-like protein with peptidoglycan-binding domain